ncbi:sensor histidine kinase [Ruminococcus sp. 5_1_39BFAA]|uniref:sensor histidine kinase n=1 Tax=Ruminococcus sp. 5_1_39BFAA TaxID=457412 RepID=UPI0035617D87
MNKRTDSWKKRYRNLKMRAKIIVSIYLILLPILLIGVGIVYYWSYRNTMSEDTRLYNSLSQSICDSIDYMQQDVLDISDYFSVDPAVHQILSNRKEKYGDSGLFWIEDTPLSFMSNMLAIKSQIKTTILYPENGLSPYYISRDASVHDTDISHVRELEIYGKAEEARGDIVWERVNAGRSGIFLLNKSDKMVAYRMLFDMAKKRKLGVLAIGIEVSRYEAICSNVLQDKNEGVLILDNQGKELMTAGQVDRETVDYICSLTEEELKDSGDRLDSGKDYIFYKENARGMLGICYVSPKENWGVLKQANMMLTVVMMLILLIVSWPLSSIISNNLSKSTKKLLASMEKFESGDFSERVSLEAEDEIGNLARAFNHMAAETQALIERNYVMALKEREIELNALQAQINPHFLYNVLDSLYWEAIDSDNEKLGDDILALSELFRLLLSQGESEITVGKEIELISHYLRIQEMRFSRRFSYQIDVDDNIKGYKISRLLLQPFVENAIVHGFEMKQEEGYVYISGKEKDKKMEFLIEDDGAGMDQEKADQLLEAGQQEGYPNLRIGHYAIRNIKERLDLRYGENNYVLKIISNKGEGTKVYIVIPIVH